MLSGTRSLGAWRVGAGGVGTGGGIPWTYLAVCCAVNHAAAAPITICV